MRPMLFHAPVVLAMGGTLLVGCLAVTGGFSKSLLDSHIMDLVVACLSLFAVGYCIILYWRSRT
jgi:hypothetical protein